MFHFIARPVKPLMVSVITLSITITRPTVKERDQQRPTVNLLGSLTEVLITLSYIFVYQATNLTYLVKRERDKRESTLFGGGLHSSCGMVVG